LPHRRMLAASIGFALGLFPGRAGAQGYPEGQIQDNSFLVEEAYNQDPGVVQHIFNWQRSRGGNWIGTFTQEWPAGGLAHQASYTLPLLNLPGSGGKTQLGDVGLNYRYQLLGSGEAAVACAPRLTLLLPTGDYRHGYGSGAPGVQGAVPVSVVLTPRLVLHADAGATYTPRARNTRGERADTTAYNLAESVVWLARPTLNVLLEATWTGQESVAGPGRRSRSDTVLISPGVRGAINFRSGLQIVPGIAFPLGVGPSAGERGVFLYLSFEHAFLPGVVGPGR
jgi:hypothetical protein